MAAWASRSRSPRLRRIIAAYTINRLAPGSASSPCRWPSSTTRTARWPSRRCCSPGRRCRRFSCPPLVARVEASARRQRAERPVLLRGLRRPRHRGAAVAFLAACGAVAGGARRNRGAGRERAAARRGGPGRTRAGRGAARAANELPARTLEERRPGGRTQGERHVEHRLSPSRSCSDPRSAGVVVAAAGASAALFIDVGSFLICGALLLDLHPHVEEAGGDSVGARLRRGVESHQRGSGPALAAARRRQSRSSSSRPPDRSRSPTRRRRCTRATAAYGLLWRPGERARCSRASSSRAR